jgi:FKBP-type peptidyl-prolyl cis-trans isomerase SlyD
VQVVPRSSFPPEVDVQSGMQFAAEGPEGQPVRVWVSDVTDEQVTVDVNHPLAGVTLHFAVKVEGIRDATAEELEHGHPHGPHGDEGHEGHDHD